VSIIAENVLNKYFLTACHDVTSMLYKKNKAVREFLLYISLYLYLNLAV